MLEVKNVSKHFGEKEAVSNLSFKVKKGEILGFLGPNGAGKSTTMRIITGYLPPTGGEITLDGVSIEEEPVKAKKKIGYLPENAPLYNDMTVHSFLSFIAELRGLKGSKKNQKINEVIEKCFLNTVIHQSIDTLSKGYRHRTCLAQSLIHDPDILILDEPTDGLDPNQKHEVRELIRTMGKEKVIIFSTHILEEVETSCTKAIVIDRGKMVASGTPAELKKTAKDAGSVLVKIETNKNDDIKKEFKSIKSFDNFDILSEEEEKIKKIILYPKGQNDKKPFPSELMHEFVAFSDKKGWNIHHLATQEGKLEEVFRTLTLPDSK